LAEHARTPALAEIAELKALHNKMALRNSNLGMQPIILKN
jgi:hypothetical protein